jgi:tRNA uridine 5-carboxymethylaminomethyl modification enzyme
MPAERALKQAGVRLADLSIACRIDLDLDSRDRGMDIASVETEFKYEGYLKRERLSIERQHRQQGRTIPAELRFDGIPGLSREMVQRLSEVRPETLGQAARIPGVTPAAVAVVAAFMDRTPKAGCV